MNIEEITQKCQEVPISSQVLQDPKWEILKQYKSLEVSANGNKTHRNYLLIKCRKCGYTKVISVNNINRKNKYEYKCQGCQLQSYIGNIYGCYKVISYDHSEDKNISGKRHFYKVRCIHCGREYIKELNTAQWKKYKNCSKCGIVNDDPVINMMYQDYKYRAEVSKNILWNLSPQQFLYLVKQPCHYCGTLPSTRTKGEYQSEVNGIDRIDSSQGYSIDNCVPCCTMCNYMKLDYSKNEFLYHVEKIYKHCRKGSTTIENTFNNGSEQSTSQANGDGNGGSLEVENDIV